VRRGIRVEHGGAVVKLRLAALVALMAIVAAGCGDTADTTTTTVAGTTATTTATSTVGGVRTFLGVDAVETTTTDTSRVVSLNGECTEILYELGLGDSVVGIDVTTTWPPEALDLPSIGFAHQLAPEPVLALEPTLVIGDQLIEPTESIDQLRQAGVPVVILKTATSLDGAVRRIEEVGEIMGVPEEGAALAARVATEIEDVTGLAATADTTPRVAFLYTRGPQTLLFFGAGMPTQAMIQGANGIDAGIEAGVFFAVPVTPEALVAAAPDVIVVPAEGLEVLGGVEGLAAVPGVAETPAGQSGSFLAYEEAYFINLGPRVGRALLEFTLDLHPELAGE